jgi:hypothetical protein
MVAFSEFELKRYNIEMKRNIDRIRPQESIRNSIDVAYRIENQSIVIYEIRSDYTEESKKIVCDIAKTTFVKTSMKWKILWMKSDLKWHEYEPQKYVNTLEQFLSIIEDDEFACFFG